MPVDQLTYSGRLIATRCWCGIRYAVPEEFDQAAHENPKLATYCPLGHRGYFTKSAADELRQELERERNRTTILNARLDQARAAAAHERSRANAYKGALVKTRQRAAKGVCPVPGCRRHFVDVQRHVESKHPDFQRGVVLPDAPGGGS